MSRAVISLLSDLAAGGRMVLASVHCPSSDSMRMFTHVLLLTHDGRLAYHGPRSAAVANFTALGYVLTPSHNFITPAAYHTERGPSLAPWG
jgi:ABC-type multidrug transport system ATPase subunit